MNKVWLKESVGVLVNVRLGKEETHGRLHIEVSAWSNFNEKFKTKKYDYIYPVLPTVS